MTRKTPIVTLSLAATGVNGNQAENSAPNSGAAYLPAACSRAGRSAGRPFGAR